MESFELGVEFQMFQRRLNGDISLYQTTTKDLITKVPLDGSAGFKYAMMNAGKLVNKGSFIEYSSN